MVAAKRDAAEGPSSLQHRRKEVMTIRNLFPDRIAMRLDEPEQVDMVLGDGARDRSAHADLISSGPVAVAETNLRELMVRIGHSSTGAALI
jgi:hypothetical protein